MQSSALSHSADSGYLATTRRILSVFKYILNVKHVTVSTFGNAAVDFHSRFKRYDANKIKPCSSDVGSQTVIAENVYVHICI